MNNDFKVTMSFAAAVAAAAFSLAAHGAVVYVSPDGKGVDEGGTGALAQPYDIYTGVAQAGDGGEVRLLMSENRYFLTNSVYVNKRALRGWNGTSDTPAGSDGRDKVILDGGETVECLYSANLQGSWTIADLTITRGCPTKEGSLLYGLNVTGNSVVSNCVFRESSCTNGMRCVRVNVYEGGSLRFINCDFRELEALDWYGFLNVGGAPDSIVFDRCRFINNVNSGPQNSYGSFAYGNADFTDCVISNNTGTGIGGFSMGRSSWTRCLFADNSSVNCGVCLYNRGTMVVNDCFFTNNVCTKINANGGGCIAAGYISGNDSSGTLAVTNCVFIGNASHSRGAVASFSSKSGLTSSISFSRCSFVTNVSGACLYSNGRSASSAVIYGQRISDFFLENCIFTDNVTSGVCAAVACTELINSHVRNCLFLRNRSLGTNGGSNEGAVRLEGISYVHNCTFVNNGTSRNLYGALVVGGSNESGPEKLVANCIFSGNSRYNGVENSIESTCNVKSSGDVRFWNCFSQYGFMPEGQGNVCGTSQLPLDPGFVAAASDDYRLKKRSLCTDAGLDFAWMSGAKDLQSLRRPRRIEGRSVDIGCYEYLWPSGLSVILK